MPSRKGMWGLLAGLGFLAGVIAACGGSTSSGTGPSSAGGGGGSGSAGAVIQGQVVNRKTAAGESVMQVVFRAALGIGLAEAAPGDPVEGVEVTLTRQDDGATITGTTNSNGEFIITNVVPGTYTITVVDPDPAPGTPLTVNAPDTFTVGAGDGANITLTVSEGGVSDTVDVVALETDPSTVGQNDAQTAHALQIARAAGLVSADSIWEDRVVRGWGWGKICKNHPPCHPSAIGLGRRGISDEEIAAFQAAHGQGNGKGNNGKGNGKGKGNKKG